MADRAPTAAPPAPRDPSGSHAVGADGVWAEVLRSVEGLEPRPALFLDRDGTIVEEVGYLSLQQDVRLIPGAAGIIATANRLGLPVVIVSNQSGIGRGPGERSRRRTQRRPRR